MKKTLFLAVAAIFLFACFVSCSTNPRNENLIRLTNKNIKNIHISHYDWERADKKLEELEKTSEEYLIRQYYGSDEYYDTFFEIDVKQEYWSSIIKELNKPKKKVGPFTSKRNPGGGIGSITVTYNNGKETYIYLSRINYFQINNVWYHYGHGPNFGFMREIIEASDIAVTDNTAVTESAIIP